MKKFVQLSLVACMFLLTASTVLAQDLVLNQTNCDVFVRVAYGPTTSCTSTGFIDAVVPAGTSINMGIPAGTQILGAKGGYTASLPGCSFLVALNCWGGPLTDFVPCSVGNCVDYKARLYPNRGIRIYD